MLPKCLKNHTKFARKFLNMGLIPPPFEQCSKKLRIWYEMAPLITNVRGWWKGKLLFWNALMVRQLSGALASCIWRLPGYLVPSHSAIMRSNHGLGAGVEKSKRSTKYFLHSSDTIYFEKSTTTIHRPTHQKFCFGDNWAMLVVLQGDPQRQKWWCTARGQKRWCCWMAISSAQN